MGEEAPDLGAEARPLTAELRDLAGAFSGVGDGVTTGVLKPALASADGGAVAAAADTLGVAATEVVVVIDAAEVDDTAGPGGATRLKPIRKKEYINYGTKNQSSMRKNSHQ